MASVQSHLVLPGSGGKDQSQSVSSASRVNQLTSGTVAVTNPGPWTLSSIEID